MSAVASIRPEVVAPVSLMPAGLDSCEQLAYRKGQSRGMGLYVKKHGGPGVVSDKETPAPGTPARAKLAERVRETAAAWNVEHGAAYWAAGHKAGMSGLRAYWKRHALVDRAAAYGPVKAPRKSRKAPAPLAAVPDAVSDAPVSSPNHGITREELIESGVMSGRVVLVSVTDAPDDSPDPAPVESVQSEPAPARKLTPRRIANRELADDMRAAGIPITVETWNAAKSGNLAGIGSAS